MYSGVIGLRKEHALKFALKCPEVYFSPRVP
jgi:hypothetical protein